jgi:hypothetical protein
MRVYLHIPDALLPTLQDQARAAHRPPRYHLEWLIEQGLQAHAMETPPGVRASTSPPPQIERRRHATTDTYDPVAEDER